MKRFLFIAFLSLNSIFATSQIIKNYTGDYEYNDHPGTAIYSYFLKNTDEIMQGPFSFKSKLGINGSLSVTGNYDNNLLTGTWTHISTWSTYNGEEHTKSDFVFSRVAEYRPFVETIKKQIITYSQNKLNGKEIILYTTKQSWGASGGGQKTTVYKKEKTWKDDVLQDFSFEVTENNIRKNYLKGKYATLDNTIFYDGEWTGMVDGNSVKVIFNKGSILSKLIKNQSSGEILKQEEYTVDEDLEKNFADTKNISVYYNDINSKLVISEGTKGSYEFEVIVNNASKAIIDEQINSIASSIKYVEKENPYDNDYNDNEWVAGVSALKKYYLSNNRKKGDFWSIIANGENANKIFDKINEDSIQFIGQGKDYFTKEQDYTRRSRGPARTTRRGVADIGPGVGECRRG